jgi:hypothetical protein
LDDGIGNTFVLAYAANGFATVAVLWKLTAQDFLVD